MHGLINRRLRSRAWFSSSNACTRGALNRVSGIEGRATAGRGQRLMAELPVPTTFRQSPECKVSTEVTNHSVRGS